MPDKRTTAALFRDRLLTLIARRGSTPTAFARRCGLDRSALSQFVDPSVVRLPRAETLTAISSSEEVSIDWLLGMRNDEATMGEVVSLQEVERGPRGTDSSALSAWHREAAGYKIRYAPYSLPDLLLTHDVIDYEYAVAGAETGDTKTRLSRAQLAYTRRPETDMEVVLPLSRLRNLASGTDIWHGLSLRARRDQINHMANLLDELYPTFRLFLYDSRHHHCAPFTVFGPKRAAVYLGDMYLVMNRADHIGALQRRFDAIIRAAAVGPDRAAEWSRNLDVS